MLAPRPFEAVVRLSMRLHEALRRVGEEILAGSDLTRARRACLDEVRDEPASVAAIAASLGLSRQGVQRVADALVADGLAQYLDNPRHRRAKLLAPTRRGRQALAAAGRAHAAWLARVGARLDGRVLARAQRDLEAVLDAVQRAAPARKEPS